MSSFKPLEGVNAFIVPFLKTPMSAALKLDSDVQFPVWITKTIEELQKLGLVQEHNIVMFYGSVKNNKLIASTGKYHINPVGSSSDAFAYISVEHFGKSSKWISTEKRLGIDSDIYSLEFNKFLQELKQQSTNYDFVPVNGWDKVYYFHILTRLIKLSEKELKLFDSYITAGASVRSIAFLCNRGMPFQDMGEYVTLPVEWLERAFSDALSGS